MRIAAHTPLHDTRCELAKYSIGSSAHWLGTPKISLGQWGVDQEIDGLRGKSSIAPEGYLSGFLFLSLRLFELLSPGRRDLCSNNGA